MAVAIRTPDGAHKDPQDIETLWRDRIQKARDAQKQLVPIWLSNLAFAAGQHWLVYDTVAGQMRNLKDVDKRAAERNLLTADRISEYRDTQLGELDSDDERPQLLVAQDSDEAEEIAKQLNAAASYAWDHEWDADEALAQVYAYLVDMGTAAIRCRRDPNHGKLVTHVPIGPDGQPIADTAPLEENGTREDGSLPQYKPVREGRTIWQPYTAFQILAPPGVHHEKNFPWEVLVDVVSLDDLKAEYPAAADLTEDGDIASAMGLSTGQSVRDNRSQGSGASGRLRGSCWRYICLQRPNREHPKGQVVVLASNDYKIMDVKDEFEYQLPNGEPDPGVVYFHWRRLNDRFYSRAWIEPLKDPQRALNNDETAADEIVARGMPKVFLQKPMPETPQGVPVETIILGDQTAPPIFHEGIGLPPALMQRRENLLDNLAHAATLSALKLGENPQNVDTYSQLALLNENETGKRSFIRGQHKRAIARLMELSVWDIRRYWPDEKQILVAGEDDSITTQTFTKAQVPDFFMAKVAKGAAQPRSQAAELKKLDAIWAAAEQSGLVVSDPAAWTKWYVDSIDAGSAQEIPEPQTDSQTQMAEYENLLIHHGEEVIPADYDLLPVHLPIHRAAQDQARASGDMETFLRLQQHIDLSVQVQQENAAKVAGAQQQPSPAGASMQQPAQAQNPIFAKPDFQQLATGN